MMIECPFSSHVKGLLSTAQIARRSMMNDTSGGKIVQCVRSQGQKEEGAKAKQGNSDKAGAAPQAKVRVRSGSK
jgi:hypothetical protein